MSRIPILMYHWFREEGRPTMSRSPQLEITPERFAEQMEFLSRSGYRSVSLDEMISRPDSLPGKPFVLTFDDGTLDFWEHARPVLGHYGFKATLFIVTDFVGTESSWDQHLGEPARPLMGWEQILELHREGHEIGSHGRSHRVLTELDEAEVVAELTDSRGNLEEKLRCAPRFFAYPRGFYREEHKRMVREAGYAGACAVVLGLKDLLRSETYELMRITIKGDEPLSRFRLRLGLGKLIRSRQSR